MEGINNNISNFDWSATINQMLGAEGAEGTEGVTGTGVIEGDSLVVTLTDPEGNVVNFTIENPELDPATGTPDAATLEKIAEQIDGLVDEFQRGYDELEQMVKDLDIGPHSTGTQKVLFDIYELMTMMIKLAQEQRKVSRDMRYADLTISTAAIQNQAAAQRRAATTGLIMSCCLTGVSILASLGMAIKSNVAAGKAAKMEMQIGADQAQKSYALSQARTPGDAASNLAKVEGSMTPQEIQNAQKNFEVSSKMATKLEESEAALQGYIESKPDLKAAVSDIDSKITTKTAELEKLTTETGPKEVEEGKAAALELPDALEEAAQARQAYQAAKDDPNVSFEDAEGLKQKMQAANQKVDDLQAKVARGESVPERIEALKSEIKGLEADKKTLLEAVGQDDKQLQDLNDAVKTDKANYEKALQSDMSALDGKLDIAQGELDQMRKGGTASEEEIAAKETEVKALQKEAIWGRAHVTNEYHKNGMDGALKAGMDDCKAYYDSKKVMLEANDEYKKAMAEAQKWGAISQVVQQLNGLCQSLTQYTVSTQESAATEMQKEQKDADAAREESSDVFSASKELFEAVIRLMNAIQDAEREAFRNIMA